MLTIKNLHASIGEKKILNGLNLNLEKGKVHVIMGPNGSGKSTLSKVIAGHYDTEVLDGDICFDEKSILNKTPEQRVLEGIFLSFQHPVEIAGVNNSYFLRQAMNAKRRFEGNEDLNAADFLTLLKSRLEQLGMSKEMIKRALNHGFSGGEKKRNEILQMELLDPKVIILDEIDSGLDIDALKAVSEGINRIRSTNNTILIITHYKRILEFVNPDYIHILKHGIITQTGDISLANLLEAHGYESIEETYNEY